MAVESLFIPITAAVILALCGIQTLLFLLYKKIKDGIAHKMLVIKDATDSFNAPYLVTLVTGSRPGAGTQGVVRLALGGRSGERAHFLLNPALYDLDKRFFHRGAHDHFLLMTRECLQDLFTLDIQLVPKVETANWYLSYVLVESVSSGEVEYFPCHQWLRCARGQACKVVLLAGYNHTPSAKFRLLLDMLYRCVRRQHCWASHVLVPPACAFNTLLQVTYGTCVQACLLLCAAMLFRQQALSPAHTALSCLPPALLITLKLWALERALYYFHQRSRFDAWMQGGVLVGHRQLHTVGHSVLGPAMHGLSDSLWQPYDHDANSDNGSHGFIPHELPTDDADWSPVIDSQPEPLSEWMTSTPCRDEPPRQLALATDSDYAVYANEGQGLGHGADVSPGDSVPLRPSSQGAGYQATAQRNNANNAPQPAHTAFTSAAVHSSQPPADVEEESAVEVSMNDSAPNYTDESKLAACYDNQAFDASMNDTCENEPRDSQAAAVSTDSPEMSMESWVFVEKPMELVLKDAITPTLSGIVAEDDAKLCVTCGNAENTGVEPSRDRVGTGLQLTPQFIHTVLNPMLDHLLRLVHSSVAGRVPLDPNNLDPFKSQLTQILNMLKDSKNVDVSARIDISQPLSSFRQDTFKNGPALTTECHSDSALDLKHKSDSDMFHSFSSSTSALLARKKRTRSIEDIQTALNLGPVARKISSLLIDYSVTSQNIGTAYSSKSQQERRAMLASLRDLVNGQEEPGETDVGDLKLKKQADSEIEDEEGQSSSVTNPLEVMGRIPPKFTGKINSTTMMQVASASLQSILSQETRARFDDLVARQCQNEALAFAEDVVNTLYVIVRDRLERLVQAEVEHGRSGVAAAREEASDDRADMASLLAAAEEEVRAQVLPVVARHVLRMLQEQAHMLDTLDVHLLMLLYGGQYVDTVVTNAVLQTHVGLVRAAHSLSAHPHSGPPATPQPNANASNNAPPACKPFTASHTPSNGDHQTNRARNERSMDGPYRMSGTTTSDQSIPGSNIQSKNDHFSGKSTGSKNNIGWSSVFKVVGSEVAISFGTDVNDLQKCDPDRQNGGSETDEFEVISLDSNNNSASSGYHMTRFMNTSENNNSACTDQLITLPDHYDVAAVTSRVLEQVHEILRETGTEDLSALSGGGEIHCGLCRPKAIKEIKQKVAAMAAGRHLTMQVYGAALGEMERLAGVRGPCDPLQATSALIQDELLTRIGQIILNDGEQEETASSQLYCQETIERVAEELVAEVMRRAQRNAAEKLIAMLRLREADSKAPGEHLYDTLLQDSAQESGSRQGAALLESTQPLSQPDLLQISHEYEQIRSLLFAPPCGDHGQQVPCDVVTQPDAAPPCTYYKHLYTCKAKYASSHNTPLRCFLLCVLVLLTLGALVGAVAVGLGLNPVVSVHCLVVFVALLLLHVFFLESVKVVVITIVRVFMYNKLP